MKKNRTMRVAVLMLALTLLTCCFVGSTFAKYISEAEGSSAARVALWDIEYNNGDITANGSAQEVTFSLFDTVKDTAGATEEDVKVGTDENIIAPGTSGSFTYTINNKSEVNAQYSIDYTVTNANNIPVQFRVKLGDGEFSAWSNTLADVTDQAIAMTSGTATYVVEWQWVFENDTTPDNDVIEGDTVDTALGLVGTATIEVAMTITVEQVD